MVQVHAQLRSQRGTPAAEVRARTLRALAVMGLWRVRNTQVRGHVVIVMVGQPQNVHAVLHTACFGY